MTGFPLNLIMTSPMVKPAFFAGELCSTENIITPVSWSMPVWSASSWGIMTVLDTMPR